MTESNPQPQQQEALELKPCPFCGTDKPVLSNNQTRCWEVFCRKCGASVMVKLRQRDYEAVDAWNTRADLPRATAEVELTVESALKELREMFPGKNTLAIGVVIRIGFTSFAGATLNEAMNQVRAWSESRAQKEGERE